MAGWEDFAKGFQSKRGANALIGLGSGLLSQPTFSKGLAAGGEGFMQGAELDQQYADAEAAKAQQAGETNMTKEWLKSKGRDDLIPLVDAGQGMFALQEATKVAQGTTPGDNLMSVGGHLYDPATGSWISPPSEAGNRQNVSLSGQWGIDETTQQPVYLQPSSTGEMVQSQVPQGVRLMGPYDVNADRAAGSAFGKNTGAAQFDLPAAELTTTQTLQAIQNVKNNTEGMTEQFGNIMGIPQQMTPAWPGSAKANFQVDTNRLINRTFLEAREVLRGGGQITDFESRKAEGAISSLEEAMQKGDKALFERSLTELEQAVKDGYAKLQSQAGVMSGYGSSPQSQAPAGQTSTGLSWSVTP